MNFMNIIEVDPEGDVYLAVQRTRFTVSSAKMAAISIHFRDLFCQGIVTSPIKKTICMPDEDPDSLAIICQRAHGSFIPESQISIPILLNLARAIDRYAIPADSAIFELVKFALHNRATPANRIPTAHLGALVTVARYLGHTTHILLLKNIFVHRQVGLEPMAPHDDIRYLDLKGLECRDQIARVLAKHGATADLAYWIYVDRPTLHKLRTRIEYQGGHSEDCLEIWSALGVLQRAFEDITVYFNAKYQHGSEVVQRTQPNARVQRSLNYLDVQVAYEEPANVPSGPPSSPSTDFEDLEEYSLPVEVLCESGSDKGSTKSRVTI